MAIRHTSSRSDRLLTFGRVLVVLACIGGSLGTLVAAERGAKTDRVAFQQKYEAWKHRISTDPRLLESSCSSAFANTPEFEELVSLGVSAVPHLLRVAKEDNCHFVVKAIERITKKRFVGDVAKDISGNQDCLAHYEKWWFGGVAETPKEFARLVDAWNGLKKGKRRIVLHFDETAYDAQVGDYLKTRRETEAGRLLHEMESLGIPALPLIVEELRRGSFEFVPIAQRLMDVEAKTLTGSAEKRSRWLVAHWEKNKARWSIPY